MMRDRANSNEPIGPELTLIRASSIADVAQEWLIPNVIPTGTLTVIAGAPGQGKTTACLAIAADITRGRVPMVGGVREPGTVFMLTNEDAPAHIRRSFAAMGGDLDRLFVEEENDSGKSWMLDAVLESLTLKIEEHRPVLVVIDSFYSHAPTNTDTNKHADVAGPLVRLRKLADRLGCAIVLIHHTNKTQSNNPLAKIAGSTGIVATARHVLVIGTHPDNEAVRVIAVAKTNLAKPGVSSHQFTLDPFAWGGTLEVRAEDLFEITLGASGETNKGKVEGFLRELLANGPLEAPVIFRQGEDCYGIHKRTLQRAADRMNIVKDAKGFGASRTVTWSLPHSSTTP